MLCSLKGHLRENVKAATLTLPNDVLAELGSIAS
jgi:aryl-alcohol dehydrogenase-like predicted oxidoreductase